MSRRTGRGLSASIRWKVISTGPDDIDLVGRSLPQTEGQSALSVGMYPDGTIIEIDKGPHKGKWQVLGNRLVSCDQPELQINQKLTQENQLALL